MNSNFSINNIKESLKNIIQQKLLNNEIEFVHYYYNKELSGSEIQLRARDLLRLYFEVENYFNIRISQKYVTEGNFNSLDNIAEIVLKEIQMDINPNMH
jgi:peptide maturation system acyl carrier-related protein